LRRVDFCRLIEERIRDAKNRNVYGKAREIAYRLGGRRGKKHGAIWVYDDGGLSIWWDDYAPNLSIYWNKTEVFSVHLGDIVRYRPDIEGWLERLEEIYEGKVKPILEEEQRREEKGRLRELKERWGIDLNDLRL